MLYYNYVTLNEFIHQLVLDDLSCDQNASILLGDYF